MQPIALSPQQKSSLANKLFATGHASHSKHFRATRSAVQRFLLIVFLSKSVTPHSRLRASLGHCHRRLPPEGFLANITPPSGDTTLSLSQISQRLPPDWLQSCENAETDQKLTCNAEYVLTAF